MVAFASRFGSRFGSRGFRAVAGVVGVGLPAFAWQQHRNKAETEGATNVPWLSKEEFRAVKCIANEPHTHDTRKISFAPVDDNPNHAPGWNIFGPVANVLIRHGGPDPKKEAKNSKSVTRNYNPLSAEKGYFGQSFTLLVKKYPDSKMGTALHALQPGDTVEAKGPNQQWGFVPGSYTKYGMIAGGTGITPIMQATQAILHNDTASVSLVCFNKSPEDVLLLDDLKSLKQAFGDRLTVTHVLENGTIQGGRNGRVSSKVLKELLPAPGKGIFVLCCGRAPMTAAIAGPKNKDYTQGDVAGLLKELGYTSDHVWKL